MPGGWWTGYSTWTVENTRYRKSNFNVYSDLGQKLLGKVKTGLALLEIHNAMYFEYKVIKSFKQKSK